MSNYGLMFNTYNFPEQPNASSQTATNYFEKQVKEGLQFFNQNKLQSTLRNNYFNSSDSNINLRSRNGNTNIITSNERNDMSEVEAKKILEREMNPYLSYMKNELKLIVDQYAKDINEKNILINDINSLKNELEILKRTNEKVGNDINEKILKNNENINSQERKLSNLELEINKLNQLFSIESNQNSQIPSIQVDLSHINDKLKIMEKNNENILAELSKVVDNSTSMKFNECFTNIKNLKEENNELKEKIDKLNNIIKGLKFENEKRNEENMDQINNNQNAIKIVNQLKIELRNKEDKIEVLESEFENIKNKILEQDRNIGELSGNIGTEHSAIITIANSMKNCNKKVDFLEKKINDSTYKKDYIDNQFDLISNRINSQNEQIKQNNNKLNENWSEENNKLYSNLLKKIEEYKKQNENNYDEVKLSIINIKNNVNNITTLINSNEIKNHNFKESQNNFNDVFKQNLIEINKEILKLKENSKSIDINKDNIIKASQNFVKINEFLNNITKNNEENLNNLINFKSDMENKINDIQKDKEDLENINKKIEELNSKIICLEGQLSINAGIQNQGNYVDAEQFNEIKKNIKKLENELNAIKDEKTHEILNIIDNKIQNQKVVQIPVNNNDNYKNNNTNLNADNNINYNTNANNNININIKTEKRAEEKEDLGNGGLLGFSRRRTGRNQQNKKDNRLNENTNKINDRNNEFIKVNQFNDNNNNFNINNNFYANNYNYDYNNNNFNNGYNNNNNYNNYDENNNYENDDNYNNENNDNNYNNENNYNNYNQKLSGQTNDNFDNENEDGWNNNQNNSQQNNYSKMNNYSSGKFSNNSKEKDSTDNIINKILNENANKSEEQNNNSNNNNENDEW